jgi:aspartyl protease family protein
LKPRPDSPKTFFVLADGRQIEGNIVTAKSVRVGKFTIEDVECAVFGPEYPNVEPLLGQSFLENFIYKIDSGRNIISITRVDGDGRVPRPKK